MEKGSDQRMCPVLFFYSHVSVIKMYIDSAFQFVDTNLKYCTQLDALDNYMQINSKHNENIPVK
jgi:hypothetical protein